MARFDITWQHLRELFDYDEETGILIWRRRDPAALYHGEGWNRRFAGKEAGAVNKSDGYRYVPINRRLVTAARVIWCWKHKIDLNECPTIIDHKDGIRLNNRLSNLRAADWFQNNQNSSIKANNKSGVKGVIVSPKTRSKPYRAHIMARGRQYEKSFATIEEAASWREQKIKELHGEFRCMAASRRR